MNVWQKISIVFGTITIALLLTVFPATKEVIVVDELTGFGSVVGKEASKTKTVIDYPATGKNAAAVSAATIATTVLLGFISSKEKDLA